MSLPCLLRAPIISMLYLGIIDFSGVDKAVYALSDNNIGQTLILVSASFYRLFIHLNELWHVSMITSYVCDNMPNLDQMSDERMITCGPSLMGISV